MKTALVTGAAGLIGRHVGSALGAAGYRVHGIDPRAVMTHFLDHLQDWDARDFFRKFDHSFDLVIHLAAVVGGREVVESPMAHAVNLELDAALFGWAERTKPGRVVYVSSVAAYPTWLQKDASAGALHETDIDLSDPELPDQLYGWAKLTGEMLASRSSVPVSVPRLFTVYSEEQAPVFPFASLAAQVRERRDPVTVWGSGSQVRDFIHVDDVAAAVIAMAEQGIDGPVNVCTGRAVSLRELIAMMAADAGYDPAIETLPGKPEGLPYRVGDPGKLHGFYEPRISLEDGIRRALSASRAS